MMDEMAAENLNDIMGAARRRRGSGLRCTKEQLIDHVVAHLRLPRQTHTCTLQLAATAIAGEELLTHGRAAIFGATARPLLPSGLTLSAALSSPNPRNQRQKSASVEGTIWLLYSL